MKSKNFLFSQLNLSLPKVGDRYLIGEYYASSSSQMVLDFPGFFPRHPSPKKSPEKISFMEAWELFIINYGHFFPKEKKNAGGGRVFGCLHFAYLRFTFLPRGNAGLYWCLS